MSKWIYFHWIGSSASGTTQIFEVTTKNTPTVILGIVKWFAPWRQYSFYPNGDTVFEKDCLRDIAVFCEDKTKEQRAKK